MSVRKRGNSWVAFWTNSEGKRCQQTFRRRDDAQACERQQRDLSRSGVLSDPQTTKQTVGSLYGPWIISKGNLKPKTLIGYESVWNTVVEPRWGNVRLKNVAFGDVKAWIANCVSSEGKKLGPSRTRQAYTVLSNILDHAVDQGLIGRNAARGNLGSRKGFLPTSQAGDARNILNREELKRLARNCGEYEDLILLMGTVGLRINEAAALKASDLDFDRNMISVSRTLSDLNGFIIEQSPKNGKTREVPIPELVRASLLNRKIASGAGGYLWSASNGSALRHSNFNRRVWGPARIASNVTKKFTMHDLRHTSASWLVQYGCSIPQLAKMLGHADPSFTLKRYTHLFDGDMDAISALINRAESA